MILPPFYYGAASYAVAPPEGNGSVQVDAGKLAPSPRRCSTACCASAFATSTASSITRPRISPPACRPTSPSSFGARQAIFRFLEKERGEGWWGDEKMADYYAEAGGGRRSVQLDQDPSADVAGDHRAISVRPCRHRRDVADAGALPGGGGHCSELADNTGWYTQTAKDASAELGAEGARSDPRRGCCRSCAD